MRILAFTAMISLCFLGGSAYGGDAQERHAKSAPVEKKDQKYEIVITKKQCETLLTNHVPDADVAYNPEEDAASKGVVPADLNPSPLNKIPLNFKVELHTEMPLFERKYPGPNPLGPNFADIEPRPKLGGVEVREGRLYYNGLPVSMNDNLEAYEACKKALRSDKK